MASSLAELEAELSAELQAAMEEANSKMFNDLDSEVAGYYAGGVPDAYHRTGQLRNTPKADPVSGGGKFFSFRVYLNPAGGYTTGMNPSMSQVLNWTNEGSHGTVGSHGYWERALSKMEKSFSSSLASHFG